MQCCNAKARQQDQIAIAEAMQPSRLHLQEIQWVSSPTQHAQHPLGAGHPKPTPDLETSAVIHVLWADKASTSSHSDKQWTAHRMRRPYNNKGRSAKQNGGL